MKAMVRQTYGPPEVLQLQDIETPTPGDDEVLVRMRAASLNLGDWEILRGDPFFITAIAQLIGPKPRVDPPPSGEAFISPKYKVLGCDVAGHVVAVGANVTRFRPGDDVFGMCGFGAFAEYVCVPEDGPIVQKPADMSFEDAASLPQATFIALQGIEQVGDVQSGQRILIAGAGGGAGTLALQLAKARGAEVTAVDCALKFDLMRSLGADHVIDYTTEHFSDNGEQYDLVLDLVATRSVFAGMRSLTADGLYLVAGGTTMPTFQSMLLGGLISKLGSKRVAFLMAEDQTEDLTRMIELVQAGTVRPILDRSYPLEDLPDALVRMGRGEALGKVVVTME